MTDDLKIQRESTGDPALDEILGGGLPTGSMTVIAGKPGSGKTILALQMLFLAAREGKKCVYFTTLSEPAIRVLRYTQSARRQPRYRALRARDRLQGAPSRGRQVQGSTGRHHGATRARREVTGNATGDKIVVLAEIAHTLESTESSGARIVRVLELLRNILAYDRCSVVVRRAADPFRRGTAASSARAPRGLGLGLYIVGQIAKAHGGTASATSSGAGVTEFRLSIPRGEA